MDDACLTDDTVLDFVAGRLADPARAQVERHLGHCLLCNRLVSVAAGYGHAGPDNDVGMDAPVSQPTGLTGETGSPALPLGTLLRDTYRISRLVGRGGMGEVFEATHSRLPGRFAVKVLHAQCVADPKTIVRFRREAEITSGLRHPNIVSIVDFDYTPAGAPYLVMEFLEGAELARVISDESPLSLDRVVRIVDQIASALAAVHRRGIVHRDLKPQNVFLLRGERPGEEHVKLCDFGISKVRAASVALTGERVLLGTPQYMAPEQARGMASVDARADQFALATIVYEMLSGRLAFPGDRVEIVVYRIANEDPLPLGGPWGSLLQGVLDRALSKEPARRYPSVEDFAVALRAAADARPQGSTDMLAKTTMRGAWDAGGVAAIAPTTVPPTTMQGPPPQGRGRSVAVGLVALGALAAVVTAAVRGQPRRAPASVAGTRAPAAPERIAPPPAVVRVEAPVAGAPPAPVSWELPRASSAPPSGPSRASATHARHSRDVDKDVDAPAKKAAAVPASPAVPDAGAAPRPRDSKLGSLIDRL